MAKTRWWTGWWLLKSTLIMLAIVVVWFLVSDRWPNSIATKLLSGFLILFIVLLGLARVLEFALGWAWLLMRIYRAFTGLWKKSSSETGHKSQQPTVGSR